MSKQLCFIIKNNKLFLDKVLVSFNATPILFVCKDGRKNYYLALCSDLENLEYVVEKQEVKDLYNLLMGKESIRSVLLSCKYFWKIRTNNDIKEDIVTKENINKIDYSVLPEEDALYEKVTKEDEAYLKKITFLYLQNLSCTPKGCAYCEITLCPEKERNNCASLQYRDSRNQKKHILVQFDFSDKLINNFYSNEVLTAK